MKDQTASTEATVRKHLDAFVAQKGIDAILGDYDEQASLYTQDRVYRGKPQIREFFADFIGGLPAGAIERFELKTLRADGTLAFITWSSGREIPMGTDTFVVEDGRIVSQTFAMSTGPAY